MRKWGIKESGGEQKRRQKNVNSLLYKQTIQEKASQIPQRFTLHILKFELSLSNFGARKQLLWDPRQLYFLLHI